MDSKKIMEEMVGQRMRSPISLRKFLHNYQEELKADIMPVTDADVQKAMKLSNDTERFETVAGKCSLTQLEQADDVNILKFIPGDTESKLGHLTAVPPGAHKLSTFKALIKSKNTNQRNPFRRSSEIYKLAQFPKSNGLSIETVDECPYLKDIIVSVRVYRPTRAIHIGRTLEKPVFAEQFQCLGSNFLTELRDKISCICNKHHFYDISDDPDTKLPEKDKDPGFFFISDTFYNDFRNPENRDYSDVIKKWAKKVPNLKTMDFHVAKMEETRIIDLTVSLGFPQLYQHHGNCEHLFTFSQVDLLTPSLTYNQEVPRNIYPRLHSFGLYNNRLCNMCGKIHYMFIVENSDRQLYNPAYLCHKCFKRFHYIDGKKIGEFRAYRLHDYVSRREEICPEMLDENIEENRINEMPENPENLTDSTEEYS